MNTLNTLNTLAGLAGAGLVTLAYAVRVVTTHDRLLDEDAAPPRAAAGAEVRAVRPTPTVVPRGRASTAVLPLAG